MSERTRMTVPLMVSIGFNIFFLAFVLGRSSVLVLPPPFMQGHPDMPGFMGEGHMPPPFFAAGMKQGMPFTPPDEHHFSGMLPPPPPLFTPDLVFTPQEMEQDFSQMKENFEKVRLVDLAFAKKLENGPVSKEEVAKYLESVDSPIDDLKKKFRERAMNKISQMSAEERKDLADHLQRRCGMEQPKP